MWYEMTSEQSLRCRNAPFFSLEAFRESVALAASFALCRSVERYRRTRGWPEVLEVSSVFFLNQISSRIASSTASLYAMIWFGRTSFRMWLLYMIQSECICLSTLERVAAVWIVSLEERTFRRSSFESEKNPTMVSALGVAPRDGGVFFFFLGIGEQLIDRQDARCGEASDEPV